jgi:hypothetical protein
MSSKFSRWVCSALRILTLPSQQTRRESKRLTCPCAA